MPRVIFHVDMDAFYASIEQRDNPALCGRPVLVGASPERRGVVCAASYEARKFGVRSAMPSRTAAKLCPDGVFVHPRMDAYRTESRAIMAILNDYTPLIEQVSVDEAYLDLSPHELNGSTPDELLYASRTVATAIKARIRSERSLNATIGIGSNKFLAKLASDFQKPDGLTVIPESRKVEFLRPLPIRSIHGVGPVTAQQLETLNLHTIGDLQDCSQNLESVLGAFADKLRRRAFGEDDRPLELRRERKSVSAEHTFETDTENRTLLREALKNLASEVAEALHSRQCAALTVAVKVRYHNFTTLTRQIRLQEPAFTAAELYRVSCHLLASHKLVTQPLRLLGIGASTFCPQAPLQMQLTLS